VRRERHQVDAAAISAVREDFHNRIVGEVWSMSRAGAMTAHEWWWISDRLVEYLAALSLQNPDLDVPEAKAVLDDATEAAAGAVAYTVYHPHNRFQVFLNYVNFGRDYEPEPGHPEAPAPTTPHRWLDSFCLAVLSDKAEWHGEAFHFAREAAREGGAGLPSVELISGFMAYVIGDTGDDSAAHPPTRADVLAALDAAYARIHSLDHMTGGAQGLLRHPHTTALHALHALASGDRSAFGTHLTALLRPYSALSGPVTSPATLLPLLPLALAALAHRREGWPPPLDTDYLPYALVTGFAAPGPRVRAFGRDRRRDAVAELAAGPVVFDRPGNPQPIHPASEADYEQYTREAFTPVPGRPLSPAKLAWAVGYQEILFKARASHSADVTDGQLAHLHLAAEMGAALFRTTLAAPGTDVEVTIDGRRLVYPAYHGDQAGPGAWHTAVDLALITGVREHLAPLVLAGPARLAQDDSAFASYREALLTYLRGEDPEPVTERALHDHGKAKEWGFFPPPTILFSQLVEGDEESFNLALLDALEAHRDHHRVADRANTTDAALNLDILALTCHAHRRGWTTHVTTPYLPPRLLKAARPF
jgi:hypothetical protein